ncbi:unnamed protein product, partial [Clonostachys rosea f. rosea IK726]
SPSLWLKSSVVSVLISLIPGTRLRSFGLLFLFFGYWLGMSNVLACWLPDPLCSWYYTASRPVTCDIARFIVQRAAAVGKHHCATIWGRLDSSFPRTTTHLFDRKLSRNIAPPGY